ncbi:hypothetical protein [Chromatium okenii]|jgi:hypothetical protein|uniref:hypothetical protein n=1 Tax=Chromatium okenii TaxID=61644 RepID=UPI0026EAE322|nr:hypothetical protein [Chromatium okenii]MBV5310741.1 hypothetical protein [Chromatium okenii]
MPVPIILWAGAALLAATGVKKGFDAKQDFDLAKSIGERADNEHKIAIKSLELSRAQSQLDLEELGRLKVRVFTDQIQHLVDVSKKIKGNAKGKLSGFQHDLSVEELTEYGQLVKASLEIESALADSVVSGALGGALTGLAAYGGVGTLAAASTGTAISALSGAAATNATLAWLGGGALSAGGFGIAGGTLALGGIVLAPVLAIGGFMMASKAERAVTDAMEYEAKVSKAIKEIDIVKVSLKVISSHAHEMYIAINKTSQQFDHIKVFDDSDFTRFEQMIKIGKGLKTLLDTAILDSEGNPVSNLKLETSGLLTI